MSFLVTLRVADKDLGPLLARLGTKLKYDLKHHSHDDGDEVEAPTNGARANAITANTYLCMSDKEGEPTPGTHPATALREFEKLEAKAGIGHVTRGDFTALLKKKKSLQIGSPTGLITAMLATGWIEPV